MLQAAATTVNETLPAARFSALISFFFPVPVGHSAR